MLLKISLLLVACVVVWALTRPRRRGGRGGKAQGERLTQCPRCGVYHEAQTPCPCEKKESPGK